MNRKIGYQEKESFAIEVEKDVIDGVLEGCITHIGLDLSEKNQSKILENIQGHLILVTDETPVRFHGCYWYNDGAFPYAIKENLKYLVLNNGDENCVVQIISINKEAGTRFRFQGPGMPSVPDPNGDSCIWELQFEVVPALSKPKTYLMRWNPSISSFTEDDYKECVATMRDGNFRINWSIFEWEEARRGDEFYMLRVGDEKAGIVFRGLFISEPYVMDDWAGTSKRRLYMDMACMNPVANDAIPPLSLSKLQESIPDFDWTKGHSGFLLSDDVAARLHEMWEEVQEE